MSLATRCPACSTVFRVVQDQLRVSEGWVRCGHCQEVFNALEDLFELGAPSATGTTSDASPGAPPGPSPGPFADPSAGWAPGSPPAPPSGTSPSPATGPTGALSAPPPAGTPPARGSAPLAPEVDLSDPGEPERVDPSPLPSRAAPETWPWHGNPAAAAAASPDRSGIASTSPTETPRPIPAPALRPEPPMSMSALLARPDATPVSTPTDTRLPDGEPPTGAAASAAPTASATTPPASSGSDWNDVSADVTPWPVPGSDLPPTPTTPLSEPPAADERTATPDAGQPTSPGPTRSLLETLLGETAAKAVTATSAESGSAATGVAGSSSLVADDGPALNAAGDLASPAIESGPAAHDIGPQVASDTDAAGSAAIDPAQTVASSDDAVQAQDDAAVSAFDASTAGAVPSEAPREWQRKRPRRPRTPPTEGMADTTDPGSPRRKRPKPAFVRQAERDAQWQLPAVRAVLIAATVALTLMLVTQAMLYFRDGLAARWPGTRPALTATCAAIGCRLAAPRALDRISLDGSRLTSAEGNAGAAKALRFVADLHNAAGYAVRAPALELSFTDSAGSLVARRVLQPDELGLASGTIAAGSPWQVDARLEIGDLPVAGFSVEIFYP